MAEVYADDVAELAAMAAHWTSTFTKDDKGRPTCTAYIDNRAHIVMRPKKCVPLKDGSRQVVMACTDKLDHGNLNGHGRRYVGVEEWNGRSLKRILEEGPFGGRRWKLQMLRAASDLLDALR